MRSDCTFFSNPSGDARVFFFPFLDNERQCEYNEIHADVARTVCGKKSKPYRSWEILQKMTRHAQKGEACFQSSLFAQLEAWITRRHDGRMGSVWV